jgi:hypothetical protein
MRIACASIYDAQDPSAFGGRVYESLQSIKRRVDSMYFLGPLNTGAYKPILRVKKNTIDAYSVGPTFPSEIDCRFAAMRVSFRSD